MTPLLANIPLSNQTRNMIAQKKANNHDGCLSALQANYHYSCSCRQSVHLCFPFLQILFVLMVSYHTLGIQWYDHKVKYSSKLLANFLRCMSPNLIYFKNKTQYHYCLEAVSSSLRRPQCAGYTLDHSYTSYQFRCLENTITHFPNPWNSEQQHSGLKSQTA